MKKLHLVMALMFLVLLLPAAAPGEEGKNYIIAKAGAFFPSGDLNDGDFNTGFIGEVALGRRFHPNFALEGSIGYFSTRAEDGDLTAPVEREFDVSAVPLMLTGKGVFPAGNVNLYGGGGIGLYLANVDVEIRNVSTGFFMTDDDSDVVFGAHLVAGVDYEIAGRIFIGVEGKYMFTGKTEASLLGVPFEGNLNGFTVVAKLGERF